MRLKIIHPKNAVVESAAWLYVFGVASCAVLLFGLVNLYLSTAHEPGRLTNVELSEPYLSNKYVRLAEIADVNGVIEGRVFRDCWIYGPAVVYLERDVEISYSDFDGPFDQIFTPVVPNTRYSRGQMTVRDCKFTRCRFIRISFLATEQAINGWRKSNPEMGPK
jgi:hypothetical protein